eukprot:2174942-Amphidinium_carterae.1
MGFKSTCKSSQSYCNQAPKKLKTGTRRRQLTSTPKQRTWAAQRGKTQDVVSGGRVMVRQSTTGHNSSQPRRNHIPKTSQSTQHGELQGKVSPKAYALSDDRGEVA